jgi:NhaA family Na+:H+ antiporter
VIVALVALANAGVSITSATLREARTSGVTLGVVGGLVVGKTVG